MAENKAAPAKKTTPAKKATGRTTPAAKKAKSTYQTIDGKQAQLAFRRQRVDEAEFQAWIASIDVSQTNVLVKANRGNDDHPSHVWHLNAQSVLRQREEEASAMRKALSLPPSPQLERKREWLNQRLVQLESEHVGLIELRDNAEIYGENAELRALDVESVEAALAATRLALKNL